MSTQLSSSVVQYQKEAARALPLRAKTREIRPRSERRRTLIIVYFTLKTLRGLPIIYNYRPYFGFTLENKSFAGRLHRITKRLVEPVAFF